MRKFSKLCAAALAMALSITMVAPISANAQVYWEKDANGVKTYKSDESDKTIKSNEVEGESSDIMLALASKRKTVTISTNSYNEVVPFVTTKDVAKFENFKSNKKDLKVKVISKIETDDTSKGTEFVYDYKTKADGKYHYKNVKGDIVDVAKLDECPKGNAEGIYGVRLYAKKAGTYKIKYEAKLKNGGTEKLTLKVIAKDNGEAIKDVTFAGKSLTTSYIDDPESHELKNNRLWTKGFGKDTTLAKSGKIHVTMNENFKLKKIEYGVIETETVDGTIVPKDADNSLDPDNTKIAWKKVKNGKKIKLSKVDFEKENYNKNGLRINFNGNTTTVTYIRITYKDTKAKTTRRAIYSIKRIKK